MEICKVGLTRLQHRSNSGLEVNGWIGLELEQHLNTIEDRVGDVDVIL